MAKRATSLKTILKRKQPQSKPGYAWTDPEYTKRRNIRKHGEIQGRGWVPGGYKYLGPGNDMDLGEPNNANDGAAQRHDGTYGTYQRMGVNPYVTYTEADDTFIDEVQANDIPSAVASGIFRSKRAAANAGLIQRIEPMTPAQSNSVEDFIQWISATKEGAQMVQEDRNATDDVTHHLPDSVPDSLDQVLPDADSQTLLNFIGPGQEFIMEITNDAQEPENQERASRDVNMGGGDAMGITGETPISIPPTISYGLPETHTTILPFTGWFSWSAGASTSTQTERMDLLNIRLNQPYAFFPIIVTAAVSEYPTNRGFYSNKMNWDGAKTNDEDNFPQYMTNTNNERAQWWETFRQLYTNYAVIGCEWELLMHCPTGKGSGIVILWDYDNYKQGGSNQIPRGQIQDMISWPNMKKAYCRGNDEGEQRFYTIRGRYKRGMITKDVENDGDEKTWTSTGGLDGAGIGSPAMVDELKIFVDEDPMNVYVRNLVNGGNPTVVRPKTCVNFQLTMKWVVQFKDLRLNARYPMRHNDAAPRNFALNFSNNAAQVGNPLALWQ
ncbi:hypothetical protein PINS_up019666 [Pythium insidiosum]|nr:hypothetical protein PINS_up019666 [Pythium insidiosum]